MKDNDNILMENLYQDQVITEDRINAMAERTISQIMANISVGMKNGASKEEIIEYINAIKSKLEQMQIEVPKW